ncbi:hypothetical protein Tco_0710303, partial [Tanacetum coccineum]
MGCRGLEGFPGGSVKLYYLRILSCLKVHIQMQVFEQKGCYESGESNFWEKLCQLHRLCSIKNRIVQLCQLRYRRIKCIYGVTRGYDATYALLITRSFNIRTEYQLDDLFTKALLKERFKYLVHRIVIIMEQPQQIIPANQLVTSKYQSVGRCNNYAVLSNIPFPNESKIVGKLLVDHALSYALTA